MYIVYKNPYKSYNIHQEGYFVSYKDKLCDNFSDNWIDAKRYKTIGPALSRLGIYGLECTSIDNFLKSNKIDKSILRDLKIESVLNPDISDEYKILSVLRSKGRIEKVIESGNKNFPLSLIDCEKEIVNWIKDKISKNENKIKTINKFIGEVNYISTENDEEFWNDFLNN